jgi:hypothetical protein
MPISATVEADLEHTAVITDRGVATEHSGAAVLDSREYPLLLSREPVGRPIALSAGADDVGELQRRA